MPITDYGMSSLNREEAGHGTSLINWFKMMATSLSLSVFTMVMNMRVEYYSETMNRMTAQMKGIDDVFFYSGLILLFNVVMTLTLKNGRNL